MPESMQVRQTRYQAFGYRQDGPSLWRVYDITDLDSPAAVGPQYRTKGELLADLQRYAEEYGCDSWTRQQLTAGSMRERDH